MKKSIEEIIYHAASSNNTLTLGSACNMSCIFCSHQFNPPELEIYRQKFLTFDEVKELCDFLEPEEKIIIGESATRIIEGEPFLHPEFTEILLYLRKRFKSNIIQITTNGSKLDEAMVDVLDKVSPVELNISLNSASEEGRKTLMRDKDPQKVLEGIKLLAEKNISFHGSIVAMPQVVGWDDLSETVEYLDRYDAKTIRIFLPGFSDYNQPDWRFDGSLATELFDWLTKMRDKVRIPLLFEPPALQDLTPQVAGVLPESSADRGGLKRNDIIEFVAGRQPVSRADAFRLIKKAKDPVLKVKREAEHFTICLKKEADETSGLIFDYDLEADLIEMWRSSPYKSVLVCTSFLAYPLLKKVVADLEKEWRVCQVKNRVFGGSICCGGLLLLSDYEKAIEECLQDGFRPEVIFLSARSFDLWGRDLRGNSYLDLEEKLGIKIILN